jgi:Na+-driven multidrug efflux pump
MMPSTDAAASDALNDHRTRRLLDEPIVPLLLRMAWPNILIMVAQAATGLIETWWVSKLGTNALAGMALAFPPIMLMTMLSAGALGGAISSSVARALGAGRQAQADALVLAAAVINVVAGSVFAIIFLLFGEPIYQLLGGSGGELEAALTYSNTVFAGNILIWLMNGLASVIRGTGNMLFPAIVICVGVAFLIPLSPLLIFGFGPLPGFGIAGAGLALLVFYAAGSAAMGWYLLSERTPVRFRWSVLSPAAVKSILTIGTVSAVNSVQTNVTIAGATALVGTVAGASAVAGFGTGARLEYLLIPLVFGIGAPLVALVGTNIGAGQRDRALRIGMVGAALAFAVTEIIGVAAAIYPEAWMSLFSADPNVIATGSAYLRTVGPAYGFFGLGIALYFASQGAGRLLWPVCSGLLRLVLALGGGYIALSMTGSLTALYGALAAGLVVFGLSVLVAVKSGAWFR